MSDKQRDLSDDAEFNRMYNAVMDFSRYDTIDAFEALRVMQEGK